MSIECDHATDCNSSGSAATVCPSDAPDITVQLHPLN